MKSLRIRSAGPDSDTTMNRVLVAYASKMDSTREIADKIGSRLDEAGFDVLVRSCADAPPAKEFSAVVIGSAIYMRRWLKDATTYLAREAHELAGRPTYLFQSGPCSDKPSDSVGGHTAAGALASRRRSERANR